MAFKVVGAMVFERFIVVIFRIGNKRSLFAVDKFDFVFRNDEFFACSGDVDYVAVGVFTVEANEEFAFLRLVGGSRN